jgi:DNA repair protein RecO (recombination protein O)
MTRQDRSFRTQALILKRRDFGEADRLLTVLTPQHGRINALAKGARRPISKQTGHVEAFTLVDMLVSRGRDLFIITQAEVVNPFINLRDDLHKSAYANYIAELTTSFTFEEDTHTQRIFDLLHNTLDRINQGDEPRLAVRYFELQVLDDAGFRPDLTHCVFTHEEILPQDQFFSYAEGGVVSPAGTQHAQGLVPISVNLLKLLRHMQRSEYSHVQSLKVDNSLMIEAERLLQGYITMILESRLKSVDFIRRLRRDVN